MPTIGAPGSSPLPWDNGRSRAARITGDGCGRDDRTIIAGINLWVYSPFMVDGTAVPMCTSVTFIYHQR